VVNVKIVRVFTKRNSYTPEDDLVFIGSPPDVLPDADEVHISVTFTWDIENARKLQEEWSKYYNKVLIGGPAFDTSQTFNPQFTPGLYVKQGVTFTSRGCNNKCPWCLVRNREGELKELDDFAPGYIINDNNFLQCSKSHRLKVYDMLNKQRHFAVFSGGIDTRLVTDEIAEEFRNIRIKRLFLACDTKNALKSLEKAAQKLSFLNIEKLFCYVLIGFDNESIEEAQARLEAVWNCGCMPFAMLYRPPTGEKIIWDKDWRTLHKMWSRPAIIKYLHKTQA
jgi:hypothetical protein